ncbi:LacI family DNA-binding transcriptional regulator [Microbacterium aquimaris]|uniref:LacI family DNA-binding transcriptional regulator n=1 Tax=Microbacterium aquimaris TaxID=459816 RepID=A0ABU5N366_9MICO|nr:LacI family DNA-binding transcriptional regulator [Microbacterium aquimaris]MDZ8160362.1 LacI family DNA-binding transcriptional regulator [Microbacterium aquimaris]
MARSRRAVAGRPQRVTIADIAAYVGVSTATVSYALNDPTRVSAETLERVRAAVEELGYTGNEAARQLRRGRSNAVALIVNDAANPAFTAFETGAEHAAAVTGHFILNANSSDNASRELAYLRFFESQQVGGIVIAPVGELPDEAIAIADRGTPVVSLGHLGSRSPVPSISGDDLAGGETAMTHLLAAGRRRPMFVGGPRAQFELRLRGAEQAAARRGVAVRALTLEAATVEAGHRAVCALSDDELAGYDAVFAGNDLLAIGVLHALIERGVDVPGRIALVGYDDIEFAQLAVVPLTTVRHDVSAMSRAAVEAAVSGGATRPVHREFPPELVVRRSTYLTAPA